MNTKNYIGIPYGPHRRDHEQVDCYGLVHLVYREELGIILPTYDEDYGDPSDRESVSHAIDENAVNWKRVVTPRPMDVLVFNIFRLPAHCGLYIGRNRFLHSMKGVSSCIEDLNSITWANRLAGVYRWAN